MSKFFSKKIACIFLIAFYLSAFSLDIFYKRLYSYFDAPENITSENLKYIEKVSKLNDTSAKWLAQYILYKYYVLKGDKKKAYSFLKKVYYYSYIESDDVINDFISFSFDFSHYDAGINALLDNTYYYDGRLLKYKNILLKKIGYDDYLTLLYSKGFYKEVLKHKINDCLKVKCLYGLRKYKDVIVFFEKRKNSYYDDNAYFFIAKSYAYFNEYKNAVNVMNKIKKFSETKKYYYAVYSLFADKKSALKILGTIKNSYFKAKIIDYIFKHKLFNEKELKKMYDSLNDFFVSSQIYFFYGKKLGLNRPKNYEKSVFYNLNKSFKFEGINYRKKYFVCYDKLVKRYVRKNVYIVYNDIMLTKYENKLDKIKDFYLSDLPYFGLNLSYSVRLRDKLFFRYPLAYYEYVVKYSKKYGVSPFLVWAIMRAESSFKWTISERGAGGLMQIMPGTYSFIKNKFKMTEGDNEIENNIKAGILYIKYLLNEFNDNLFLSVLAYNAGPGNVKKWLKKYKNLKNVLKNVPYFESERYLYKVFENYVNYIKFYSK